MSAPGEAEPFFADRRAMRRNFERAAGTFAQGEALHREVASRMLERLDYIRLAPRRIIDLGCAIGAAFGPLGERYAGAVLTGVDFAHAMARRAAPRASLLARWFGHPPSAVCADLSALPFAAGTFGMAWSNLALHWLDDPQPAFMEAHRVLDTGGLLMFSMLGPDTLKELRLAFAEMDTGWHVKRFVDLHDVGDVLVRAGFANPVMDMEVITLTYDAPEKLFADLRFTGSANAMTGRARGLSGRAGIARLRAALAGARREGRMPATFEVIYGHAWKPAPRRPVGEAVVKFTPRRK